MLRTLLTGGSGVCVFWGGGVRCLHVRPCALRTTPTEQSRGRGDRSHREGSWGDTGRVPGPPAGSQAENHPKLGRAQDGDRDHNGCC